MEQTHLDIVTAIVENLSRRAKEDSTGVYWESTSPAAANRGGLAISIMSGTPGILMFLVEYLKKCDNPAIRRLVERALEWCLVRLKTSEQLAGYYVGVPGALYATSAAEHFLYGKSERSLPILSAVMARQLKCHRNFRSSIGNGIAGTLLAYELLIQDGNIEADIELRHALLAALVSHAELSSRGLFWDRYPDVIKPSFGFLTGNAGIEFLLAQYTGSSGWNSVLIDATARYQSSYFDHEKGHWPDMVSEEQFTDVRNLATLHRAVLRRDKKAFEQASFSASWDNGSGGILMNTAFQSMNGERFAGDRHRATLASFEALTSKQNMDESPLSLDKGLTGLAMASVIAGSNPESNILVEKALVSISKTWNKYGRVYVDKRQENWRLGLLNGESGIGYFLLRFGRHALGESSVLYPHTCTRVNHDMNNNVVFEFIMERTFPRASPTVSIPLVCPGEITLESAAKSIESSGGSAEMIRLDKQVRAFDEHAPPSIYMFAVSAYRSQLFQDRVANLERAEINRLSIRIVRECSIKRFQSEAGDDLYYVWRQTVAGVKECKLNAVYAHVYLAANDFTSGDQICTDLMHTSHTLGTVSLESSVSQAIFAGLKAEILEIDERRTTEKISQWVASRARTYVATWR